jgi:hypothetical protein
MPAEMKTQIQVTTFISILSDEISIVRSHLRLFTVLRYVHSNALLKVLYVSAMWAVTDIQKHWLKLLCSI